MPTNVPRGLRTCLTLGSGLVIACSVAPAARAGRAPDPTRIARAEMAPVAERVANAYDIVLALRPAMLVLRGVGAPTNPASTSRDNSSGIRVYIDEVNVGGVEMLRTVPSEIVVQVKWLSAIDATTRYGRGHGAGVIGVTTRSPR